MRKIEELIPKEIYDLADEELKKEWQNRYDYEIDHAETFNKNIGDRRHYDCPICLNKGQIMHVRFEPYYNNFSAAVSFCKCLAIREAKLYAINSGLNDLLENNIDSIIADNSFRKSLKQKIESYLASKMNNWFIILGQSGAGKTLSCSIIANAFLNKGTETLYIIWSSWIKELKRSSFDDDFDDVFSKYEEVPVLYIDDFLKGRFTDTDLSYAFDLINSRYNRKLITIISGERLLDEIVDIDEAIAGRIKQMAGDFLIQIGKDPSKNYRFNK